MEIKNTVFRAWNYRYRPCEVNWTPRKVLLKTESWYLNRKYLRMHGIQCWRVWKTNTSSGYAKAQHMEWHHPQMMWWLVVNLYMCLPLAMVLINMKMVPALPLHSISPPWLLPYSSCFSPNPHLNIICYSLSERIAILHFNISKTQNIY